MVRGFCQRVNNKVLEAVVPASVTHSDVSFLVLVVCDSFAQLTVEIKLNFSILESFDFYLVPIILHVFAFGAHRSCGANRAIDTCTEIPVPPVGTGIVTRMAALYLREHLQNSALSPLALLLGVVLFHHHRYFKRSLKHLDRFGVSNSMGNFQLS